MTGNGGQLSWILGGVNTTVVKEIIDHIHYTVFCLTIVVLFWWFMGCISKPWRDMLLVIMHNYTMSLRPDD